MKKYEHYKNSGVDWLGQIPEHWEVKKLKFLLNGKLKYGANESGIEYDFNLPRYVRITDFGQDGKLSENNKLSLSWKNGDILFARSGATVGKTYQFKKSISLEENYCYAGYLIKAEANENLILNNFLYLYTNSDSFNKWKESVIIKATIENIGADKYNQLPVAFPPFQEQTGIAEFLDDKTAKIDQAIVIKQQQIDLLKERRQILIHKAVTQGINPNVKLKDSGVEWIGEIPEGWEVKRLKHLFEQIKTGTTPSTSNQKFYNGTIDWYNPKDLNNESLFYSEKKISQLAIDRKEITLFPSDSILIVGIGGTTGKTSYLNITGSFNQQITGFHSNKQFNKYYFYLFHSLSKVMLNTASYTTLPILNNEFFKSFWLIQPSFEEQKEIVDFIKTATTKIATAISLKEQEIEKLKEYKISLIDGVVTGKVRVY